jgi:hypothetical protein
MNREDIEKVEKASSNINTEPIKQLKAIFTEVFTEGKVDFAKLKAILEDTKDASKTASSLYDRVIIDSQSENIQDSIEGKFVADLEKRDDVKLFICKTP